MKEDKTFDEMTEDEAMDEIVKQAMLAKKKAWENARLYSKTKTDAEREEIIRRDLRRAMRTDEEGHPPDPPPQFYKGPITLMVTKETYERIYRELYKELSA